MGANIQQVIKGKPDIVEHALVALFSEGHLLLEDVPGTGKTTLARTIAESIDSSWKRIQFTPDLLPSDVTGAQIYDQATSSLVFKPGAIFANVVLADEINRASPKTQSALLEVMEERQHTVDAETYVMQRPFVVIATQNPIEHDGTYRLPEAQLDRFLLKTGLGYLAHDTEVEVLRGNAQARVKVQPCLSAHDVENLILLAQRVHAEDALISYIVQLAAATRNHPQVRLGVSTRGALSLLRASRSLAATRGDVYVTPDHVRELVGPVFTHRLLLTPDAEFRQVEPAEVLQGLVESVPPPIERVA
ncbi:MAG: AAA domain-containing protein [Actinomycetia bacterium]|nr:AAA domain-containing protein [Actinomycetes bacterium]